jgi:hypothetical protein
VQADIAEYVNYVTPVSGVKEILAAGVLAAQGERVTKAFDQALNG